MRSLILPVCILLFAACSNNSAISKQFTGADRLVINFTDSTGATTKVMTTTEEKAIKKLVQFVDGKTTEAYKCGYDGNLVFYNKDTKLGEVSFNYKGEGCRHFSLTVDGKLTSTKMKNEAADFLEGLAEGRHWY